MPIVRIFLEASLAISWVYYLLCVEAARHWAGGRRQEAGGREQSELGTRNSELGTQLPVTILKPLRGADPEQLENFRGFCTQDYPEYQIVFGALDADDPGLQTARQVQEEFPDVDIHVVSGGEVFGANRKVCNLANMASAVKHPIIVLCDSDMRVTVDYLSRITAPFADEAVGVVTCLYRGRMARSFGAIFEAMGIGADFIPSVILTARYGAIRFALGSTIAIRRESLDKIGGFRPLADELADDYLIGNRAAREGYRVVLSDYVVDDVLGCESLREMWIRRLRWARTTRAMQPIPVFFSYLTHGTALAFLALAATGFAAAGWWILVSTLTIRLVTATAIARLYTRDENLPRYALVLPLSDLLSFGLWVMSFLGKTVEWRGEKYRVGRRGQLTPLNPS